MNSLIERSKELKYFQIIMLVILWVPVVTKVTVHCIDQTTQMIFSGTLLASSTMGLTLFDLFGEIVTKADLKLFLRFGSIYYPWSIVRVRPRDRRRRTALSGFTVQSLSVQI